jgi:flagellar basal-body rod protein FlgB
MDLTLEAVRVGLDLNQLRMQIASSNIAKADVPGTRLERASFSEALAALHEAAWDPGANPARLASITPQTLRTDVQSSGAVAANPVALDDEIAELNADSVAYRALATGLTRRFALMQLAIAGK